jgi:lipoprotein-releasing system permease protein
VYKLHLILKYLRKRRIAWVSLVAVMLCTAMVLVVISVMGGWLRMFRESFKGLSGDVMVEARSLAGFAYYEEMIAQIERLPEVHAAVPTIQTFGLLKIGHLDTSGVRVMGYPIEQIGRVNRFPESLHRQHREPLEAQEMLRDPDLTPAEREMLAEIARRTHSPPSFSPHLEPEEYRLRVPDTRMDAAQRPGMIVSPDLVGIRRGPDGTLINRHPMMYRLPSVLTLMDVTAVSLTDPGAVRTRPYWIVDDSYNKVWEVDQNTVYVPFDVLQRDLGMEQQEGVSIDGGERVIIPARTTNIHVALVRGSDLYAARTRIAQVVEQILDEKQDATFTPPNVLTWEEKYATFLSAVEKEKALVTFLFGMISVVAIFLIFAIFYMIVVEKTKDIGIIKSVGATGQGVAGVFLGYGLAIGVVGSGMGLLLGFLVVRNINYLHDQISRLMTDPIWNPEVYMFDTIPNTMNPTEVAVIIGVAIVASVLGALVPAIRAARMNPVEALRWE